jgi:hypothetical protein
MSDPQIQDIAIIRTVHTERVTVRSLPAPGPPGPSGDFPIPAQVELELDVLYPTNHKEVVYDLERVVSVITWDSPEKQFKIFSKTFSYDISGRIDSIAIVLELSGARLVKTLNRDAGNKIISVDRLYTP